MGENDRGNNVTNKEILQTIQALRACASGEAEDCPFTAVDGCGGCPKVSADLIERLTAENAELRKEIEWKDMVISLAQRKQAKAEAERDALLEQIKARRSCLDCKHFDYCEFDNATVIECMNCVTKNCPCAGCGNSSHWEWRGLQEAPEEGGKA